MVKSKNNDIESYKRKIQQIESERNTLNEQIKICNDRFESERSTWSEKQENLLKEIEIYENKCTDKDTEKERTSQARLFGEAPTSMVGHYRAKTKPSGET